MYVCVFGNYIFAKEVTNLLLEREHKVVCLCNNVIDDNKYGLGIQKFAREKQIELHIGKKKEHLNILNRIQPNFAISAAYKFLIPVEDLNFDVYGIHFGGLYGKDSIRGKSSSKWYRLTGKNKANIILYKMLRNKFDIGKIISEVEFQLGEINDDPDRQIQNYRNLLCPILDLLEQGQQLIDDSDEIDMNNFASYYPKTNINQYSKKYFNDYEINFFKQVNLKNKDENIAIFDNQYLFDERNECYVYTNKNNTINIDNGIIYLHGFGSKFSKETQNNKLVKLCSLLDCPIIAPTLKGINSLYCDGNQESQEVIEQFRNILSYAQKYKSLVVCTSISCLILSDFLLNYDIKNIVFITPIIKLAETSFDRGITDFLMSKQWNSNSVNLQQEYLSQYKISTEFLSYLASISLLENLKNYNNNYQIILSRDDNFINAEYWRREFIEIGTDINDVNIIDGDHIFRSPLQLYYLSCQIKKIIDKS